MTRDNAYADEAEGPTPINMAPDECKILREASVAKLRALTNKLEYLRGIRDSTDNLITDCSIAIEALRVALNNLPDGSAPVPTTTLGRPDGYAQKASY